MDIPVILIIASSVNRFVELVKPAIKKFGFTDDVYTAAVQLVAVLVGILIGLIAQVNLLAFVPTIPPVLGIVITGAFMGFGGDVLNGAIDLLYSWQKPVEPAVK
jgi:uncharacterized protein (DUF697 family)